MSERYFDDNADWSLIPDYMRDGVELYVMHGIPPGSFMTAVLSNDLKEAFARADDENTAAMHGWVRFLYNFTPSDCQGSPEKVAAWIDKGGINRRRAA